MSLAKEGLIKALAATHPSVAVLLETGRITVTQAERFLLEKWRRAFPDYDIEKVFWQSVYGVGLFWLFKVAYGTWAFALLATKKPETLLEEFLVSLRKLPLALPWSPLGSLLMPTVPVGEILMRAVLVTKNMKDNKGK